MRGVECRVPGLGVRVQVQGLGVKGLGFEV